MATGTEINDINQFIAIIKFSAIAGSGVFVVLQSIVFITMKLIGDRIKKLDNDSLTTADHITAIAVVNEKINENCKDIDNYKALTHDIKDRLITLETRVNNGYNKKN